MLAFFEAARANLVAAKIAQQDLTVAFAAIGVDYMELHPVIYRAIRKEAMVRGAEAAAALDVSLVVGFVPDRDKPTILFLASLQCLPIAPQYRRGNHRPRHPGRLDPIVRFGSKLNGLTRTEVVFGHDSSHD